ncbi:hypothetical protein A0J48_011265 [Sphaerospermopsis aphanizomenoides BCCUSP55]|uniref:hypothetical protein n=1 Tax=Sphaerospermopsis aphanizomenoides TaxID=459663 RepID=UPI0019061AC4|nr:hypothetical protein [Sphaerospermopsis aphanizomenoides]MBK1988110.1 hypothetical protein [Sphaerospermopsis aphanizomenoides BCCUSP55]
MPKTLLNEIINQLNSLEQDELQQLNQAIQIYLTDKAQAHQITQFHQALLNSGLVKEIKQPTAQPQERTLIQVQGKPVSQTIIEERC